jgi:hypothetical protein
METVEIRKDTGTGWQFLTMDTHHDYTDTTPFPTLPTMWKYRATYTNYSQSMGPWSNIAEISVGARFLHLSAILLSRFVDLKINTVIYILPLIMPFCACSGVSGSMLADIRADDGVLVTDTRSYGIEVRNNKGYRGVTIGSRLTTYVHAIPEGSDVPASRWGFVPLPNESALFTRSRTIGVELSWEPSFSGISAGIDARSCARLDMRESSMLMVDNRQDAENEFTYKKYKHE